MGLEHKATQGLASLGLTAAFSLFSKVAACVVAITAALYAIGSIFSLEYYYALGAPWAALMQSPLQILSRPGILLGTLVPLNIAVLAHMDLNRKLRETSHPKRRWLQWILAVSAGASLAAGALIGDRLRANRDQSDYLLAAFVLLGLIGCWISWAMVDISATHTRKPGQKLTVLAGLAFVVWFLGLPVLAAKASYLRFIHEKEALGRATLADAPEEDWRVVGPLGDRLLLISGSPGEKRSFRVVYPEAIERIESPANARP